MKRRRSKHKLMRRDIGGEVIAALIALAMLVFAVVFGIVLTISDDGDDATATPDVNVVANVGTQVETEVVPTDDTVDASAEGTATVDAPTPTQTERPATGGAYSPTPRPRNTGIASAVGEDVEATEAVTPEAEATETQTLSPSETATVTASATATATATNTATSTRTATATNTDTFTPSPTPTNTATSTRTPTRTPRPTETFSIYPTDTVVPSLSATDTPEAIAGCGSPAGWPTYVVQRGDTLYAIARAVNSTVDDLRDANCIADVDAIYSGAELFVPRLPLHPVETGVPGGPYTGSVAAGMQVQGCGLPFVQITSPNNGQRIRSAFTVRGAAQLQNLAYYKLEIRSDTAVTYNFWSSSTQVVANGVLGTIEPGYFEPGVYWVRLVAVDNTGNVPQGAVCVIPVIFE